MSSSLRYASAFSVAVTLITTFVATEGSQANAQARDPVAVEAYGAAQARLGAALVPLRQLQEAYPDLKTNENFLQLQSQLEGTENRITVARRDYNETVQAYNTEIRTFPSIVAAKVIYGSEPIAPFKATTANANTAPAVAF